MHADVLRRLWRTDGRQLIFDCEICATLITILCYTEEITMKRIASSPTQRRARARSNRLREVMTIAEQEGLLEGERTQVIRGRMPRALVARAKNRTGIVSDTDLIEIALANIAVADDYTDWLLTQRGAIPRGIDLEF